MRVGKGEKGEGEVLRVGKGEGLWVGKGERVEGGKKGMGRVKGVKRGKVKCGKIRVREKG